MDDSGNGTRQVRAPRGPGEPPEAAPSLGLLLWILRRCLPWLAPVRGHLIRFALAVAGLGAVALAALGVLFDVHWTRVLQGHPLTPLEAGLLGLDPGAFAEVERLDAGARRQVRNREVLLGIGLAAVVAPLAAALGYYFVWILQRINQLLRVALFDRIQGLSLRFHAESRVGDSVYRLFQDSAMVTDLIQTLVLGPVAMALRYASSLLVVAVLDPWLAGVLALAWPPALALGIWVTPRLRRRFRRAREANSALTSRIQETVAGLRVIQAYGAEAAEQKKFEQYSKSAFQAAFEARNLYAVLGVAMFAVVAGVLLATTALAALRTQQSLELFAARLLGAFGFTAWNLGLFNLFKGVAGATTSAIEALFQLWARAQDIAVGLGRVHELLDTEPEVRDAPDAIAFPGLRDRIRFRGVRFAYRPDRPVLRGVDLEARAGEVTAIVGPTGAGKTTLMWLLLRLFDPDAGRVEIDGVDLRRFTLASLRRGVAIALQENVLFGATLRENIRYAAPGAGDAAVREAARVACVEEFAAGLPQGYDTLLGERGARLSTGQRQRISIARAVLMDAPILILDEPTASLDAETEIRLLENLAAWGRDRAVLLVTHRLSTLRRADRIAFLEAGRVIEEGSHAALVRRGGAYGGLFAHEAAPVAGGES